VQLANALFEINSTNATVNKLGRHNVSTVVRVIVNPMDLTIKTSLCEDLYCH